MRIDGEWFVCDDGLARPVIRGELHSASGAWIGAPFLIDTGADHAVLNAAVLRLLSLPAGGEPGPGRWPWRNRIVGFN